MLQILNLEKEDKEDEELKSPNNDDKDKKLLLPQLTNIQSQINLNLSADHIKTEERERLIKTNKESKFNPKM